MFALMLPIMLGFIGLAVEVGYWFSKHRDLQAAADVAAFAGSYDIAEGLGYTLLFAISTYEFEKAKTAIILLILLITVIDQFCLFLRKKII